MLPNEFFAHVILQLYFFYQTFGGFLGKIDLLFCICYFFFIKHFFYLFGDIRWTNLRCLFEYCLLGIRMIDGVYIAFNIKTLKNSIFCRDVFEYLPNSNSLNVKEINNYYLWGISKNNRIYLATVLCWKPYKLFCFVNSRKKSHIGR